MTTLNTASTFITVIRQQPSARCRSKGLLFADITNCVQTELCQASAGLLCPALPVNAAKTAHKPISLQACQPFSKPFLAQRDRNLAARLPPTLKVTYRVKLCTFDKLLIISMNFGPLDFEKKVEIGIQYYSFLNSLSH